MEFLEYNQKIISFKYGIEDLKKELHLSNSYDDLKEIHTKLNKLKRDLKIILEAYFEYERQNKLVINLEYRDLYKYLNKI